MWQRKQTIYLITIVLLMIVTAFISPGVGLKVISAITAALAAVTIFLFRNRMLQKKACLAGQVLIVVWMLYVVYLHYYGSPDRMAISFFVALPVVAYILYLLARQGIQHDEDLVRSADRIR